MNPDKEIVQAQDEFEETVGACYIFLTKNGMNRDVVKKLLRDTLDEVIQQVEEKL